MFCSAAAVESLAKCPELGKLKTIVCFDALPSAAQGILTSKGIKCINF